MKKQLSVVCIWLVLSAFFSMLQAPAWGAGDAFFLETFDNASSLSGRWTGGGIVTEAHGTGLALKIDNGSVVKNASLRAVLTASDVAGRRVVVRGQVKAANISTRSLPYNGIKVILVYTMSDGSTAYSTQATVTDGTFDWMGFCFPAAIPSNVSAVSILVGLEAVSGTVWFDDLIVEADPAIFVETFDNPSVISSRWSGSNFTMISHDAGYALSITNTNASGRAQVVTTLPAAVCTGHRLLITGQVKATGVSDKPNSWNGIKVMVTYTTADGQVNYPQATIGTGTFDWTNVYAVVVLPSNVTSITLALGLEFVTGTVAFDNIKVESNPILFNETFDDSAASSRWTGTSSLVAHGAGQAIEITNVNASGSNCITRSLPCATLRGRVITLQASVKGTNISTPPNSWNGIKVMITYSTSSGTYYYPQLKIAPASGTFDWTKIQRQITIPDNATSIWITLGLELSSGTLDIDDVAIKGDTFSPYWVNTTPNYKGHSVPRLRGTMVNTSMTSSDLSVLASWKANVVRWQLGGTAYAQGLGTPTFSTALNNELAKMDALLPNMASYGIAVTLDLHSLSSRQFDNAANQKKLIDTWRTLAARYKNGGINSYSATIWAYDINNEPRDDAWTESLLTLSELSEQTALAIREVDTTKAIIIEPYDAEVPMTNLRPARTNNVVYEIHSYNPWSYVSQGVDGTGTAPYTPITYPGTINGVTWNSQMIRSVLQPVVDFQNKYGISIYVGEFSVARWSPGGAQYLIDSVNVFESLGWDWTYHVFREAQCWSLEIDAATPRTSSTPASTPTDRQIVITNAFLPNILPAP